MKLKKFKERNHKQFGIIVFTITCILLVAGVVLYRTFAVFEVKTNQNVIKGTVQDPGNIYFAFYQMDDNGNYEIQKAIPKKEEGYRLDTKNSYCGVNGDKDSNVSVSMTNDWIVQVKGMTTSRTKCNLYFKKGENFVEYIQKLSIQEENSGVSGLYLIDHSSADITWEGTEEQVNNLKQQERRFAGKNYDASSNPTDYVHNYVNIDGQIWRVIGLVNTPEGQRIKLVKQDSIGEFAWDISASNINNGHGVNEWSNSDIMKLLNNGYDRNELENNEGVIQKNEYINNSLYWNREKGSCYKYANGSRVSCDFVESGIPENLKKMLEEVTWNMGSSFQGQSNADINVIQAYNIERSNTTGDSCKQYSVSDCNDNVEKTTSWKGKVGLIYPSDYGFATIGNATELNQTKCQNIKMGEWNLEENLNCNINNWMFYNNNLWTMTPSDFINSPCSFSILKGQLHSDWLWGVYNIYPSVYLSTSVLLVTGDGSFDNMFRLSL